MHLKINETAKLTGVTVRTLHYYDEIGLLKPNIITEAGYRLYDEENLETLQQILFFRELDFPLKEIKNIVTHPSFDRQEALNAHRELLLKKRRRLDGLITLIEQTMKGETSMSFKEFDMKEIEKTKEKYEQEVKERWGTTAAYAECSHKTASYGKDDWMKITENMQQIFTRFAQLKNKQLAPDSPQAKEAVKAWQTHITQHFYPCTLEILKSLGTMYVEDTRFKESIDKVGEGTAEYMAKAIEAYE